MDVSFDQLRSMVIFAQVVEQGNFSAAAKHIGLSRAVVSYHIKKLETQLGIKLLNRSTRSIALTEAGEQYYQRCRSIAEQASAANQQIENLKSEAIGLLKITCPVNLGLQAVIPALNDFKKLHPKIELDVMLSDERINILQEGIDLAVRGAPLPDSGLQAIKLTSLQTCLCAAPAYLAKHGLPTSPADLSKHNWVIYKLTSGEIALRKGSRNYSIKVNGTISTNNAAARTVFVEGGHGLGRVPLYDAQPKIHAGSLVRILEDYTLPNIDVYGVYPPGSASSKKLRLLLDFLLEYFRAYSN